MFWPLRWRLSVVSRVTPWIFTPCMQPEKPDLQGGRREEVREVREERGGARETRPEGSGKGGTERGEEQWRVQLCFSQCLNGHALVSNIFVLPE